MNHAQKLIEIQRKCIQTMSFHLTHPELLFYPPEGTYENILNEIDELFQKYINQYQSDRKAQMNIQESELWSCEDAEELKSLFCNYIDDEVAKHEDVEIMVGKEDGRLILKFENVFIEPSGPFEEGTFLVAIGRKKENSEGNPAVN